MLSDNLLSGCDAQIFELQKTLEEKTKAVEASTKEAEVNKKKAEDLQAELNNLSRKLAEGKQTSFRENWICSTWSWC